MTLNDGYGDHLSIDEIIRSNERLLRLKAADRTVGTSGNDWDDVLNEGRIAEWEVLEKRPGAPREYVSAAMSMRMTEVLQRGVWTGMEGHRGRAIDPIRRTDRDSFDDPDFQVTAAAPDVLDAVEWGYHEGEILQAIRDLPRRHQEYVILRFWGGWTNTECAPVLGIHVSSIPRMWTETIRPVLAERLAHLVGAT